MIRNLEREEFVTILHTHLSPTAPIQSEEHLFGRSKQLQLIEQALCAPGRSIFVYGDRGVGKTSLAHTVAYSQQSANHEPVLLACSPHTTFAGLLTDTIAALQGPKSSGLKTVQTAKLAYQGIGVELSRSQQNDSPSPHSFSDLNSIVSALMQVISARQHESTVVVVDEFDRIASDEERSHFADFIKQIGDQRLPVRFVFCGVAESMQKLLGTHGSCYRYLEGIELRGLSYDARYEIIDAAAKAFNVVVGDRPRHRIAAISDGFPHYVHRMCEHLFWQMFNDPLPCSTPTIDHYRQAVAESVLGIEQHLKVTYEKATMKNASGYEEVLWAIADHADLVRNTESIYESYCGLFGEKDDSELTPVGMLGRVQEAESEQEFESAFEVDEGDDRPTLDRQTVVSRLSALKKDSCGRILMTTKKGWYQFRENIMRGYVRLRAEEQGYELALDYAAASTSADSTGWRQRGAKRRKMTTSASGWRKVKK